LLSKMVRLFRGPLFRHNEFHPSTTTTPSSDPGRSADPHSPLIGTATHHPRYRPAALCEAAVVSRSDPPRSQAGFTANKGRRKK
jgi:hypothetical protein